MDAYRIDAQNYQRSTSWSRHTDTRASIILAFNGALVALLVENQYAYNFFSARPLENLHGVNSLGVLLFLLFVIFFACSSYSALRVLMMNARKTTCEINAVFSFMNITDMSREEYRENLSALSDADVLHAWEDQTYLEAQLASKKLRWINHGWWFLSWTILCAILFILLIMFFV